MRWRGAYVEPWGRGQVGPGSWAAGGKHPVVGGVVSDHRQQEHERHRAEDHHAPTHQRRQLRRCNRQIAIFRFEIVTVPACLTGWLSVYATDYQKPKSLSVLTTIFPPPFRLAASVLWCWSWEKEGRAVEVVPGIYAVHQKFHFPCAQLPGPVHTARLGRMFFIFSLGLYFVCLYYFNLFVCPHPFVFPWAVESSPLQVLVLA